MKSMLRNSLAAFALVSATLSANAIIGLNPNDPWQGFMNVFEIPQNGGGYVFGSGWGTADLRASFAAGPSAPLTLACNTIGDANPFWYTP